MPPPIYMDHHATTPADPRVVEAMRPWFTEAFGNAASRTHAYGWSAAEAVEHARRQVAALVGVSSREVVFTSGATEADNLALKGVAAAAAGRGDHLVTVATEHRAVLDPCRRLAREGWRVTFLPVAPDGLIDPAALRAALTDRTVLVSVMAANNEVGVLQPLDEVVAAARAHGALVHTDAAQAAGAVPFDARALDVDLVSLSAHKMYGPKGVGALVVRRRTPPVAIEPLLDGGGHERGLRSGTLNVPGIVGFGLAAEIAAAGLAAEAARVGALRDRLLEGLREKVGGVTVNGSLVRRLPNNLHVSFDGIEGEALLMAIGDIAVSTGAACSSASDEPSHVLAALGADEPRSRASIRFGLGRGNTAEEVDAVVARLATVVGRLRRHGP
jgi:cysteine desulfurase